MNKLKIRKYEEGDYEKHLFKIEKDNMKFFVDKYEGGWGDYTEKNAFYEC